MLWNFMLTLVHTFDTLFFDPDTFDQYFKSYLLALIYSFGLRQYSLFSSLYACTFLYSLQ